jgi:hemerythrin-like domain-containing protein
MTITEVLTAEHSVLVSMFEHIELRLNLLGARELRTLAGLVEELLYHHAQAETDIAYAALDHALAEKGPLDRLYQDHQEIDARLKASQGLASPPEARRLFQSALLAAREHFDFEESNVFPLIERTFDHETLVQLGQAWRQRQAELQPAA